MREIAIVPFGKESDKCNEAYPVTDTELNNFFGAGAVQLINRLDDLANPTPCASTNLYESLEAAVIFLGDRTNTRFYPAKDSKEPPPRLSIVLLSDGFDSTGGNFEQVRSLLERNRQIIVHTLGYGLTPEQLGQKYRRGRPATPEDLWWGEEPPPFGKIPAEEYVDRDGLAQIPQPSGGIAAFSANAGAVAKELQVFLNALLGEYEISYPQPNSERGKTYQVSVTVKDIASDPKEYWISVFGKAPPLKQRLILLSIVVGVLIVGGLLPFLGWGYWLKQQAKEN